MTLETVMFNKAVDAASEAIMPFLSSDDANYRKRIASAAVAASMDGMGENMVANHKGGLTALQVERFQFIKGFIEKNKYSPSYTEMMDGFGVSRGQVHQIIRGLVERGHVRMMPGKARSLSLA